MPDVVLKAREVPEVTGKPHPLKANPTSHRPANLLFLDSETLVACRTPGVQWHKFRLGITCYLRRRFGGRTNTEQWYLHKTPESLCREVEDRTRDKTSLFVYASNPGFDLWVLRFYSYFAQRGWKASFLYDEGMRFILVCRSGSRRIKICAVQNYYPVGIKKLGEWLGLPKLDTDPLTASESDLIRYCRRDVEILKGAVLRHIDLCEKHDTGGWGLTISGQAFNAFRHKHLSGRVWVHREAEILAFERQAYFGGRTEAFRLGVFRDGPYVEVDVNSLYPYVMHAYHYPVNLERVVDRPTTRQVKAALTKGCVVAEVELDTDRPLWAVLVNKRCCFPVGKFRAHVCSMGLALALSTGALKGVVSMTIYRKAPLFRSFVESFYAAREGYLKAGDEVSQRWCKLLMNSLYGKFGQANPIQIRKETTEDDGFYRYQHITKNPTTLEMVTQLMHTIWVHRGRHEHRDSMPAVAAHVTEYGRFYLARLLTLAGWDNVLYCDTDSLLLPADKLGPLKGVIDPTQLGALSVKRTVKELTIYGLKDYVRDGQRVLKGVPESAEETSPGVFSSDWFPGTKTMLAQPRALEIPQMHLFEFTEREILDFQKVGLYPIMERTKTVKRQYDKGVVGKDGRVKPYLLT